MKTLFVAVGMICALTLTLVAQAQTQPERRVIEVSGSAERWITPDEFTFKITLNERMDKKEKITIDQQETSLRRELSALGVDVAKDLSVYDISSTYFRRKVRDVLGTKDYRLKIRDLKKIAQLQDLADRLNVGKLELMESEHSEITRLRRETKMDAMKAAKDKADYLLGSIGQRTGKPVYIKEEDETQQRGFTLDGASSNSISANFSRQARASVDDDDALSFSQIKLRFVIVAKFEIE
jgi:uncharacterized protein YggE